MNKAVLIIPFLTVIAPIAQSQISMDVQVFCTRHEKNGSITLFCCPGFEGDGKNCKFLCHHGCANGQCVGPLVCLCNQGFSKQNGPNSPCEPITRPSTSLPASNCDERCNNGTCVEGACICERGWTLRRLETMDICVPRCEKAAVSDGSTGCVNGPCSEEFHLLTDSGYICMSSDGAGLWLFFELYYPFIIVVGLILL